MSILDIPRKLILTVATMINLVIAAATVFSAYGGMIDPHTSAIPAVASLTFPIFLVATVLLLIINVFISRRLALINLITLLACLSPALHFCPLHLNALTRTVVPETDRDKSFSIITYNVLYFRDMRGDISDTNETVGYIINANADIVALQEAPAIGANLPGVSRAMVDSLNSLYPHRASTIDQLTLLSKYPIEEIGLDIKSNDEFQVRCHRISINGRTLHLVNVHLKSIGLTPSDKQLYRHVTHGVRSKSEIREVRNDLISKLTAAFRTRADQAGLISSAIDGLDGDVVLCGDFNDIPGSYAQREIISDRFRDAYAQAGFGPAITYHADRFYFRIDHILYRGNLQPWTIKCERIPSSDHYPLKATFVFD